MVNKKLLICMCMLSITMVSIFCSISFAAPVKLINTASPLIISANGSTTSTITAYICDATNAIVTTAYNTVTFSIAGFGSLIAPTSKSAIDGIATINMRSMTMSGTVTVTATSSGLTQGMVNVITTSGSTPTKVINTANPTSIAASGTTTSLITSRICDSSNNTITTATNTLTFSITGQGILLGTVIKAAVSGLATVTLKSTTIAGTATVTTTVSSLSQGTVDVLLYSGSASVGGISNTSGTSLIPAIKLDHSGNPVVSWCDNTSGHYQIYIRKWSGSSWNEIGNGSASGGGISNGTTSDCTVHSLIINDADYPVASWVYYGAPGNPEIYVKQWNGSNWTEVGSGSASGGGISNNSGTSGSNEIALGKNGEYFVAWEDNTSGNYEIYVKKWNGTAWVEVGSGSASGGGISNNSGNSSCPSIVVNSMGYPVVAWQDTSGGDWEIYIKQWNGTAWVEIGSGSASGGGVSNNSGDSNVSQGIFFALDNSDNPILTWEDTSSGNREIYLKQWNGSSWIELAGSSSGGGISNDSSTSRDPAICTDNDGNPMVIWRDTTNGETYIKKWNGSAWIEIGSGSASGGGISNNIGTTDENAAITKNVSGFPIVAWPDTTSGNGEIYVKQWNGTSWEEINVPSESISGKVTTSGSIPIAGAIVEVLCNSVLKKSGVTDSNGNYTINITSGTYDMRVIASGYWTLTSYGIVVNAGQKITNMNFATSPSSYKPDLEITGITCIPANPQPGSSVQVKVCIHCQGNTDVAAPFWVDFYKNLSAAPSIGTAGNLYWNQDSLVLGTTTTVTGIFTYEGGTYRMYAQIDTEAEIDETIETNNIYGPVTITESANSGNISGNVFSLLDGKAIKGAIVTLKQGGMEIGNTNTNISGNYAIYVSSGTYDVQSTADTFETKIQTNVVVGSGQSKVINFGLGLGNTNGGIISGIVTKTNGVTIIQGVKIDALMPNTTSPALNTKYTDVVGLYRLVLSTGTYDIQVTKAGYQTKLIEDVLVQLAGTTNLNITLLLEETRPEPINDLYAAALLNGMVKLIWTKSISQNIDHYNIYYYKGEELDFDSLYGASKSQVSASTITWTSPELSRGEKYYFSVRPVNTSDKENLDTNMVVSVIIANNPGTLKAVIKVPSTGKKISGNRLTVVADIVEGNQLNVSYVKFEYKESQLQDWSLIQCPQADTNHTNPDLSWPYFIHWDITGLTNGNYDLRAVAYDKSGNPDSQPAIIMISKNDVDFDIQESFENGQHNKRERVNKAKDNMVKAGGFDFYELTEVDIPENALEAESDVLNVDIQMLPSIMGPLASLASAGQYREVTLDSGQDKFAAEKKAELVIPYNDENKDGIIDNTNIKEDDLEVWSYSEKNGWLREDDKTIDKTNKKVTVRTGHLTTFALFAPEVAVDLKNVIAFPSPFKSSLHNKITFANLNGSVNIKIYNIAGELVWNVEGITTAFYEWNVVNNDDESVASGIYIYVITDDEGNKATQKFTIIK